MAYSASGLSLAVNMPPGRNTYRYDTTDHPDVVEAANYFNNVTNDLNFAVGDRIQFQGWSAAIFASGSLISYVKDFIVTNVIPRGAVSEGRVNIAEIGISSAGALSSLL